MSLRANGYWDMQYGRQAYEWQQATLGNRENGVLDG